MKRMYDIQSSYEQEMVSLLQIENWVPRDGVYQTG